MIGAKQSFCLGIFLWFLYILVDLSKDTLNCNLGASKKHHILALIYEFLFLYTGKIVQICSDKSTSDLERNVE